MFSPTDLPPALLPVLEAVRSWADDESGFHDVGAEGRAAWLAGLRQLVDAAEAAFTHALAELDTHGDGEGLHGSSSTQAWLRGALRVSAPEAGQQVRIARGSRSLLAEPLRALAAGQVTYEQVKAIERTVHRLPDASTAPAAVALLTDLARAADIAAVRTAGQRIVMTVDPDGSLAQVDKDFTRRSLHLSPMLDGLAGLEGCSTPRRRPPWGRRSPRSSCPPVTTTPGPPRNAGPTAWSSWPGRRWRPRPCRPCQPPRRT